MRQETVPAVLACFICWIVLFLLSEGGMGGLILLHSYVGILIFTLLLSVGVLLSKIERLSPQTVFLYYIFTGLTPYILFFLLNGILAMLYPSIPQIPGEKEIYYMWTDIKYAAATAAKTVLPWLFVIYSVIFSKTFTPLFSAAAISSAAISQKLILIVFGLFSISPSGVSYLNVEWFGSSLSLFGAVAAALSMYLFQKNKVK